MADTAPEMVRYEEVSDGRIAIVTLDRPEARNAQNKQMTYELNDAFTRAAHTDSVKCIVLAANGPHFSAGHDLKGPGVYDADPRRAHARDRNRHLCRPRPRRPALHPAPRL